MNFEDFHLPTGLVFSLKQMAFRNGPSDIQSIILPYSLDQQSKRNLIVQAKTGTGKTISYLIHVLARLQTHSQALILLPTVELAFTVGSGIEKMSTHLPHIQITYAISSDSLPKMFKTSIIIATIDIYRSYRKLIDFARLQILILDEIDTMIIREDYRHNLLNLFENLTLNSSCQILAYSSTVSEQIRNFTNELIPNAILVKQKIDKQKLNNIEQFYVHCREQNQKNQFVNSIVEQFQRTQIIVFCLNDQLTEDLYEYLITTNTTETEMLTTKVNIQQRISLVENFRLLKFRIFLISAQTSATLHGIDLDHVNIVINYNMPQSLGSQFDLDYVTYHQRLDRCGRYDQHGYLFNLIETADDWNIQLGQTKYFSFIIEEIDIDRLRSLVL